MVLRGKLIVIIIILLLISIIDLSTIAKAKGGDNKQDEVHNILIGGERIFKERDFVKEDKKTVYLTFDDGPSELTPKILDILQQYEIEATFFVIGLAAAQNKEIVRKIAEAGHGIGNHTYSHYYKYIYSSFTNYWGEIQRTEQIIFEITGNRTALVRAPGGTYKNWDSFYFYYMDQANYLIYDWNVDSGDAKRVGVTSDEIINTIKKSKLSDKLIVLMHDSYGHQNTVAALPEIIKYYKALGYQFKKLTVDVEPIIQPVTPSRWKRDDEYLQREIFVRAVPMEELSKEKVIMAGREGLEEKKVDIWLNEPYHKKIAEAFYDYNEREWWISLNQIKSLLDINIEITTDNNVLLLNDKNTSVFLRIAEPLQLMKGKKSTENNGLKQKGLELFVPLKPILQLFKQDLYWNQGLSYLIVDPSKYFTKITY